MVVVVRGARRWNEIKERQKKKDVKKEEEEEEVELRKQRPLLSRL